MTATLADAGLDADWFTDLCARTHKDWRFFAVVKNADDAALPTGCGVPVLIFINDAGRRVLINAASARGEVEKRHVADSARLDAV